MVTNLINEQGEYIQSTTNTNTEYPKNRKGVEVVNGTKELLLDCLENLGVLLNRNKLGVLSMLKVVQEVENNITSDKVKILVDYRGKGLTYSFNQTEYEMTQYFNSFVLGTSN